MVALGMEAGLAVPEGHGAPLRPVDARLVTPAIAAWAAAAAAGTWPPAPWLLGSAGGVLLAAPAVIMLRLIRRRTIGGARGAVALTALVFLAAGILAGGLPARHRHVGPLADLARRGAAASAELVVTDDPRALAAPVGVPATIGADQAAGTDAATTFVVPVRLERLTSALGGLRLRERATVLARGRGWRGLLPSQRAVVSGRLVAPRPGDTVAAVLLAEGPPRLRGRPTWLQRTAGHLRAGLRGAAAGLPEPRRGLLPALIVGDVSGLGDEVRADFRAAGMSHLTAVSGSNVAIVTASVLYLVGRTGRGPRWRAVTGVLALVGFVVLARPSASVVRAAVMGLIGLLALALGRPRAVLPALAATVTVLVLLDPALALSIGFALSVLATTGMIVLAPGWRDVLARRLPGRLAEVLAVAAAAQLACTPVLAWTGGGVSLVAVPANVLAVCAVPPATALGVLTLLAAVVSAPAARLVAHLADLPCWWLVEVATRCAGLPAATVTWPAGVGGAAAAGGAAGIVVGLVRRRAARRLLAAAVVGLLAARFLLVPRWVPWPPAGWRLVACDVGQGDALVLSAGPGSAVLVDAGGDPRLLSRCLRDLQVRRLPVIVLSHFHADHVDGLTGVLGRLPVGEILVSPLREPALQWRRVHEAAHRAGVPIRTALAGSRARVGAVSWTVLAPRIVLRGTDSDPNNASLVLAARVGEVSVLLTGDIEPPAQRALRRGGPGAPAPDPEELRADVLKVPHHGAADQDPEFLAGTGARFALISVGAGNSYGHPSVRTVAALRRAGMAVGRTDRDGALAVVASRSSHGGPPVDVAVVRRRSGGGS